MTDYATAALVRAQIDLDSSDDDSTIEAIITAVSRAFDIYCNCERDGFVAGSATTRQFAGRGKPHLMIDTCAAITTVESKVNYADSYTEWASADWVPFAGDPLIPDFGKTPYNGVMVTGATYSSFPKSHLPSVRITAQWGYATSVPTPVQQACIIQSARLYKRGQSAFSDALASANVGMLLYRQGLDPEAKALLDPYRQVAV